VAIEDFLEDKSLGGKRKADAEVDSDKDDSLEDLNMAKKPQGTPKTPKAPVKDDDIDDLADKVQSQVNLGSWFVVDRTQNFGDLAVVFTNPKNKIRYVHIRIEVVGSIDDSQVEASITEDGKYAQVQVKFPRGGELTNPAHLLVRYPYMDELHPLYQAMSTAHRFYGEANEMKVEGLRIELPFTCDSHGFYDPIDEDDEFLDLGVYPLDLKSSNSGGGGPPPSTKLLSLFCEEQKKARLEQKTRQRSFFPSPSPGQSPTSSQTMSP
jgi:hypothetical protein